MAGNPLIKRGFGCADERLGSARSASLLFLILRVFLIRHPAHDIARRPDTATADRPHASRPSDGQGDPHEHRPQRSPHSQPDRCIQLWRQGHAADAPGRHFAILTGIDARLDPAKYAGLAEGEAHVIRNAGGRTSDDAIRSLVISYKLLGTREWFVIHHTDCGMETFTDDGMRRLLRRSLKTASIDASGWHDAGGGSPEGEQISWLTIPNQEQSVLEDVQRIRNDPLVPGDIPIYGYVYDVKSGKLIEVPAASAAGRAR